VLRVKFIVIRAYIKKTETSQINSLMHLKLLEKQEQHTKSKNSRQREIIKIRDELGIKKKTYTKNQ
jgi:hypothetical protein